MVTFSEKKSLIDEAFKFWLTDHEHFRSPFPKHMHTELKHYTVFEFEKWITEVSAKANEELTDEVVAEKFEQIMFDKGLDLAHTGEEQISIQYPFLPRVGDDFEGQGANGNSKVTSRALLKEGDQVYLSLDLLELNSAKAWNVTIELPA